MLHVSNDIQYCLSNIVRLSQSILPEKKNWVCIQNAQITVVNPSFADDITLAASDVSECQQSINTMQEIELGQKLRHSKLANTDPGLKHFL